MGRAVRRRFTINDDGDLVDREGNVLGRVVGLTLDVPAGGKGGLFVPSSTSELAGDGGVGEGAGATLDHPPLADELSAIPKEQVLAFGAHPINSRTAPIRLLTAAVNAVWGAYQSHHHPRRDAPDDEDRKIIRDALAVATVADCIQAIEGCAKSEFHMGKNDKRKKYNQLSQILRGKRGRQTTRERIEFFMELAEKGGQQSGVTSASDARVRQARREVLDAYEFPNDEQVAKRGSEAEAWLREQGWKVEREENGRPRFIEP